MSHRNQSKVYCSVPETKICSFDLPDLLQSTRLFLLLLTLSSSRFLFCPVAVLAVLGAVDALTLLLEGVFFFLTLNGLGPFGPLGRFFVRAGSVGFEGPISASSGAWGCRDCSSALKCSLSRENARKVDVRLFLRPWWRRLAAQVP